MGDVRDMFSKVYHTMQQQQLRFGAWGEVYHPLPQLVHSRPGRVPCQPPQLPKVKCCSSRRGMGRSGTIPTTAAACGLHILSAAAAQKFAQEGGTSPHRTADVAAWRGITQGCPRT